MGNPIIVFAGFNDHVEYPTAEEADAAVERVRVAYEQAGIRVTLSGLAEPKTRTCTCCGAVIVLGDPHPTLCGKTTASITSR